MEAESSPETSQQQALALHQRLTPEYESKALYRTEHLLPTLQVGCEYGHISDQTGIGWAFAIGRHFFNALDCKLTQYLIPKTKQKRERWTQGSSFDFPAGYVLHSAPRFPQCCLQITEALPAQAGSYQAEKHKAEPTHLPKSNPETGLKVALLHRPRATVYHWQSTIQTKRDPGKVVFDLFLPGINTTWQRHKTITTTQDAFVRLLITGEGLEG